MTAALLVAALPPIASAASGSDDSLRAPFQVALRGSLDDTLRVAPRGIQGRQLPSLLMPPTTLQQGNSGAYSFFCSNSSREGLNERYPKAVDRVVFGELKELGRDYFTQLQFPYQYARRSPKRFIAGAAGIMTLILTDEFTYDLLVSDDAQAGDVPEWATKMSELGNTESAYPLVLGFLGLGILAKSPRETETGVMLFEALLTSGTWTALLKELTGRERPRETGGETSDWTGPGGAFDDEENREAKPESFPSGHATGIWATATILAHQYPAHKIVPALAYATAAGISYSRMVVGAHWLSDVVVGGFIGYGCARQVLSSHRERARQDEDPRLQFGAEIRGSYRGIRVQYRF